MPFLTPGDLQGWASKEGAAAHLPEWASRLIDSGLVSSSEKRFLHGASTNLPGVDGFIRGAQVRPGLESFIPPGDSVWEFSVSASSRTKIGDDAAKRMEGDLAGFTAEQTTIVFVTPRGVKEPEKLRTEIKSAGSWKDVLILDGPRLYDWLALNPAIALDWAGTLHGVATVGLKILEQAWGENSGSTEPALTEELVIAKRDDAAASLLDQLAEAPRHIYVRGDSTFEAQAFVLAAMRSRAQEKDRNRTLVGLNYDSALSISNFGPSIVVVGPGPRATTSKLERDGHHVIVAYGDPLAAPPDAIVLEHPDRWEFSKALEAIGLDEHQATRIAREVGSSITVMSRLRPHGIPVRPWWFEGQFPDQLRPFCLIGQWDASNEHDRKIIEKLTNESWEVVQERLVPCLAKEDSPFAKAGQVWALGSHVDLFTLLAPTLGDALLRRFADVVRTVFKPQPTLTAADADDLAFKPPQGVSEWLRDGLAQALLLLAVRGPHANPPLLCPTANAGHVPPESFVARLLSELASLGSYRQLYESIRRQYSVLIEAGPDPLLEALERWLEGSPVEAQEVLASKRGFLVDWPDSTEMLWGLEVLAWSADHLPRIATVLAQLAQLQPRADKSGRRENKPLDALSRILMWWSPQTFATLDQRVAVIDQVVSRNAELGWQLLTELSPTGHMTQSPTAKPRMRDFAPDQQEVVTRRIVYEGMMAVVSRLLELAGTDVSKWTQVIESFSHFPPDAREDARRRLESLADGALSKEQRGALWSAIRDETARHRQFARTDWALGGDEIECWEQLQRQIEPDDPITNCRWLFDEWVPDFPEELVSSKDIQTKADEYRQAAITALLQSQGVEAVLELARQAKLPNFVGSAAGAVLEALADVKFVASKALTDDRIGEQFVSSLLWSASRRYPELVSDLSGAIRDIIDSAEAAGMAPSRTISAIAWLPFSPSTVEFVASLKSSLAVAYWKHMPIPVEVTGEKEVMILVKNLLTSERGAELSQMVSFGKIKVSAAEALAILDAAIEEIAKGVWSRPHALPQFLTYMAGRSDVSDDDLARREILIVPLLGYHHGVPLRLYKVLSKEPALFIQFICQIYRKASDRGVEPEAAPPENAKHLATRAYQVLSSWHHQLNPDERRQQPEADSLRPFPGEGVDGNVDGAVLGDWVAEARRLAAEEDRLEVADAELGHLLAYAPVDPDDNAWPSRGVREVVEQHWSKSIAQGICTEQFNKRGVHGVEPGGVQEQGLRDEALEWAKTVGTKWPKTQRVLQDVAKMWEHDRQRALEWDAVRKLEDRTR